MASKKTLEERIALIAEKEKKAKEKASQIVEQRKLLERKQQDIDRRQRTKRLIEIGAAAESVLGRPFEEGEVELFMNFLRQQEKNGSYFSRALEKRAAVIPQASYESVRSFKSGNEASAGTFHRQG